MSNWGWQGLKRRALEFVAGQSISEVSPPNRARIRYNDVSKGLEASIDGSAYGSLAAASSSVWLAQPTWYVDEINGNDGNDGATPATALATLYEYVRRIGTGTVSVTISTLNILGDITLNGGEPVVFRGGYDQLTIQGTRTVVRSGSITALQIWDPALNDDGLITDVGVASWLPDVNRMLVLTSGANIGSVGWVAADPAGGSDTCRYSPMFDAGTFGIVDPAVLDTYDVVTLSSITGTVLFSGAGFFDVRDLHFADPSFNGAVRFTVGQYSVVSCQISGPFGSRIGAGTDSQFSLSACNVQTDLNPAYHLTFFGACLLTARQELMAGCNLKIDASLWQGVRALRVNAGANWFVWGFSYMSVWDVAAAGALLVAMAPGSSGEVAGKAFGEDNDGAAVVALSVDSAANLTYLTDATLRFGFVGATLVEASIAGDATITYAGLGVTGSNGATPERNAAIVPSTFAF
jgi:hypothetical protein